MKKLNIFFAYLAILILLLSFGVSLFGKDAFGIHKAECERLAFVNKTLGTNYTESEYFAFQNVIDEKVKDKIKQL